MTNTSNDNLCSRCGKKRINKKTWKETVGTSVITYTETVCPDKACQKIVESDNLAKHKKREMLEKKRNTWALRKKSIVLGRR